jgi:hypothetical protein
MESIIKLVPGFSPTIAARQFSWAKAHTGLHSPDPLAKACLPGKATYVGRQANGN